MNKHSKSSYRWIVLAAFTAVAGVSQMLWLNFAPLLTQLMEKYNQSESMVGLLILVFPILYVVLSIPSGAMIDKYGYKSTIGFGSIIMAIFALLRIFNGNFYVLLVAQIGIAVGQPFVVNGISKLVADWFPHDEHALATGLGTVGMFVGMALGMGLTPALVVGESIDKAMIVFAAISVASAIGFMVFAKENNVESVHGSSVGGLKEFKALLGRKDLRLLFIISFIALGYFNGLSTWIEPILAESGFNTEQAGLAGALMILGGILGSIVIPALSDKFRRRKTFLIFCSATGLILTLPFCTVGGYNALLLFGAALGFFFLPGYALLLTMSEESVELEQAGATTSLLMLTGNAGGTLVVILMQVVKGNSSTWINAIYLMMILSFIGMMLSMLTKETFTESTIK